MTEYREVRTQEQLGAALTADDVVPVCVGEGFFLIPSGSATVQAYGSATVQAYDSATVQAYGSATVRAYDSATVRAYGSATVRACDSATVRAYDSATVRAYDSATVRAYDSATVRAYGSATVQATPYVAIHQHHTTTTIHGGHVIHVPDWNTASITAWADYVGITAPGDTITVYKAVGADLRSNHGTHYPVGETVTAPDWDTIRVCGGGLHFSQTPRHARRYHGYEDGTRYLACQIEIDQAVALGSDKIKAAGCVVLHEVTIDGEQLPDAKRGNDQ